MNEHPLSAQLRNVANVLEETVAELANLPNEPWLAVDNPAEYLTSAGRLRSQADTLDKRERHEAELADEIAGRLNDAGLSLPITSTEGMDLFRGKRIEAARRLVRDYVIQRRRDNRQGAVQ